MRDPRTEAGHIPQLLRRFGVGYPGIRFQLRIEERPVLQTSGGGNLATTLAELYHRPLAEMLKPVSFDSSAEGGTHAFTLDGYVGNRALAQASRQHITLFINGRWVQSRPLQEALEAGYRGLLPKGKHPLLVLHIDLPAEELDVNVHPAKTEVKLGPEAEVAAAVKKNIRTVLERSPALPQKMQCPGPRRCYHRHLHITYRRGHLIS